MNRFIFSLAPYFKISFCILIVNLLMIFSCTDHKDIITFDFPDYKPRLVVLASVGTISGAEVSIFWSKPLIPQVDLNLVLPQVSVFLLKDGIRDNILMEDKDAIGYYRLQSDKMDLKLGTAYAIEILDIGTGKRIISKNSFLPQKPELKNVVINTDPKFPFWYDISWTQGNIEQENGVGATSLLASTISNTGDLMNISWLNRYFLSPEFRFTDGNPLPERKAFRRFNRASKEDNPMATKIVQVRLAFLSPELSRFKQDIDKLGYFGESIYQSVQPVYSNIIGAEGIFGLYNESMVEIGIKE